jgi:hypothetical protein
LRSSNHSSKAAMCKRNAAIARKWRYSHGLSPGVKTPGLVESRAFNPCDAEYEHASGVFFGLAFGGPCLSS